MQLSACVISVIKSGLNPYGLRLSRISFFDTLSNAFVKSSATCRPGSCLPFVQFMRSSVVLIIVPVFLLVDWA